MRVDLFDFELPDERIALRPAVPRDTAKMLVVSPPQQANQMIGFSDVKVSEFVDYLNAGDAVIFNNTKVIPAQLQGMRYRQKGIKVSATLHRQVSANEWKAFIRPGKRIQEGDRIVFVNEGDSTLEAIVCAKGGHGEVTLRFTCAANALNEKIMAIGKVPLPPYIASRRNRDERDIKDYQTIYAQNPGAVAAPTAGLHFTDKILTDLKEKGVSCHFITLHVGAGTFLPVKTDNTEDHIMHSESGFISKDVAHQLNGIRKKEGRIIAVGTTSLRLLESATGDDGVIQPWSGPTDIFITPGYQFRAVDGLLTNFHLPQSTLFMLVSAFSGLDRMQLAYQYAIKNEYRFYSYGDACLLFRS